MGKHNRIEPKKFSFLGSTAGAFGALMLASGIFIVSQISSDQPHIADRQPQEQQIPKSNIPQTTIGRAAEISSVPPTVAAAGAVPPVQPPTNLPVPIPPVVPEVRVEANVTPNAGVDATVDLPDVSVDAGIDIDIPLLSPLVDPLQPVLEPLNGIIDPITDLFE